MPEKQERPSPLQLVVPEILPPVLPQHQRADLSQLPTTTQVDLPLPAMSRPPTLARPAGTPLDECAHNFDLTRASEKAALVNASNPADWQASDGGSIRLTVTRWIVLPTEEQIDEYGEVKHFTPTVFLGSDGRTARLNSDWAPRRLRAMLGLYSQAEWDAGIEMEFGVRDSRRKGMRYGTFRIL